MAAIQPSAQPAKAAGSDITLGDSAGSEPRHTTDSIASYVASALDARVKQGLERHVADELALQQIQELLEPTATATMRRSSTPAA